MTTAVAAPSITISRASLARALRLAAAIKAKTVHVDLGEQPAVSAYTSDVGIRISLDADAAADGTLVIHRGQLAQTLAFCTPTLALTLADEHLNITSGPATYRLAAAEYAEASARKRRRRNWAKVDEVVSPAEEYGHDFSGEIPSDVHAIEAPVLAEALRRALPFASRDYTRPLLRTVALFPTRSIIVGTDSYRLAEICYGDTGNDGKLPLLLDVLGAESLSRAIAKQLGQVELWQREVAPECVFIRARFDDVQWSMRRPRGDFPDYLKLLDTNSVNSEIRLTADRADLLAGARAAAALAVASEPVRLTADGDGVRMWNDAMSRDLQSAANEGASFEIGLNPVFIADLCAGAPVEHLTLIGESPLRPLLAKAARDTYLLMPIRLNV